MSDETIESVRVLLEGLTRLRDGDRLRRGGAGQLAGRDHPRLCHGPGDAICARFRGSAGRVEPCAVARHAA